MHTHPSPAHHRSIAVLALLLTASLLVVAGPAEAAPSRDAKRTSMSKVYSWKLKKFQKQAAKNKAAQGTKATGKWGLNWRYNGCSAPDIPEVRKWNAYFVQACNRHDIGYANYGKGRDRLMLVSTNRQKTVVDSRFLLDMQTVCDTNTKRPRKFNRTACYGVALTYHQFIRDSVSGRIDSKNPQNAWHGGHCTKGALCLFDDHDFHDTRWTFRKSKKYPTDFGFVNIPDFKVYGFGDKTSSVWNRSGRYAILHADDNYKGRSICIAKKTKYPDLRLSHWFNDSTSSLTILKRGKKC